MTRAARHRAAQHARSRGAWYRVFRRNPVPTAVALFLLVAGINQIVSPASVGHLFSTTLRLTWGAELVVGGVLAAVGIVTGRCAALRPGAFMGAVCFAYYAFVIATRAYQLAPVVEYVRLAGGCLFEAAHADDVLKD